MKLNLKATVYLALTHQQQEMDKLLKFLKEKGIRFRVSESGANRSIYVTVRIANEEFRVRFADHPTPQYKDERLNQARSVNFDLYPGARVTLSDVFVFLKNKIGGPGGI